VNPSETREYKARIARAWRWRKANLTADEIADHLVLSRRIAAKRRWDTSGRLPREELKRRAVSRSMARSRANPEARRAYMRDYYARKPWKWATSRANRYRHRGQTFRFGDERTLMVNI